MYGDVLSERLVRKDCHDRKLLCVTARYIPAEAISKPGRRKMFALFFNIGIEKTSVRPTQR
jgi:hypothetical protein